MDRKNIVLAIVTVCIFIVVPLFAQNDPNWDNTAKSNWNTAFKQVEIVSSVDGHKQKAFIYSSQSSTPQPLIVSLHTWSGDYTQKDSLTSEILACDWNYIHPDFRGPNNSPDAMGSPLVLSDIEDAIRYAVEHINTDLQNVHIVGVSGGEYATLLAYMNINYPVKSFSTWAPISDIEAWYWESVGRKQKYAKDIMKAISTDSIFNTAEAVRSSPLKQVFPQEKRKDAKLFIYEGIHDGYTGSVPITHAIHMYNRLVGELKYNTSNPDEIMRKAVVSDPDLVSEEEIIDLKRINPDFKKENTLFGCPIYLFREHNNIQLTIFEGGHEQLPQALDLVPCN